MNSTILDVVVNAKSDIEKWNYGDVELKFSFQNFNNVQIDSSKSKVGVDYKVRGDTITSNSQCFALWYKH